MADAKNEMTETPTGVTSICPGGGYRAIFNTAFNTSTQKPVVLWALVEGKVEGLVSEGEGDLRMASSVEGFLGYTVYPNY